MLKTTYHHGDLKNALIKAGAELLLEEGVRSLSLRKVAAKVGVSHSAPYAHFPDKEALIAAITTEGFRQLYARIAAAIKANQDHLPGLLVEVACAYVQFAIEAPAFYKLMFSGMLINEQEYPELVQITKQNFQLLVDMVRQCQAAGILPDGPEDVLAVSIWSLVHGFSSLLHERQISHTTIERYSLRELIEKTLAPVTRSPVPSPNARSNRFFQTNLP